MHFTENQEVMVFANIYGYSISVSRKNQNDEYERIYIPVSFRKGVVFANQTKIKLVDSWLSFYTKKTDDKKKVLYIFVNEFELVE